MEIFIITVLAFLVGWKASEAWHLLSFRTLLEQLNVTNTQLKRVARDAGIELEEDTAAEGDALPTLDLRIEQQPEGLFAYRKDNCLFVAMGKDREELMANIVNNLSNVRVTVAKEDGADLITP